MVMRGEQVPARGEVYLAQLRSNTWQRDPQNTTLPSDLAGRVEPALTHSHDCSNDNRRIRIPMARSMSFRGQKGFVATDQLRTVDVERLQRRVGRLAPETVTAVLTVLQEMFAP